MIAVVLPTWLSLCWDRLTHAILLRGFLPEVFRKRKASERDRCHSFFLLVYNFFSSKRLLRHRVFSHLSSSADFRKAFEDLSDKNRKKTGVKPIWLPPSCLWLRQTLQAVRPKIHEIIKTSPFTPKCSPRSPKSMKSKRKPRDFPSGPAGEP